MVSHPDAAARGLRPAPVCGSPSPCAVAAAPLPPEGTLRGARRPWLPPLSAPEGTLRGARRPVGRAACLFVGGWAGGGVAGQRRWVRWVARARRAAARQWVRGGGGVGRRRGERWRGGGTAVGAAAR